MADIIETSFVSTANIGLARSIVKEATGDGSTNTVDIDKVLSDKSQAYVTYGGIPIDLADFTITANSPTDGKTRITLGFTPESGEKIKVLA